MNAAFLLPCGEARRGAKPSRLPVSSYSSRIQGQDREATRSAAVLVSGVPSPLATYAGPIKDVAPFPRRLADLQRRRGFLSGPERSGVRRLAICHAAFHVGAYATGNAAVNPCAVRHSGRRRIHQIRSLKLNARQELAGQAHRCGTDVFPRTESFVVSFTGLSVFHDRNLEKEWTHEVQRNSASGAQSHE